VLHLNTCPATYHIVVGLICRVSASILPRRSKPLLNHGSVQLLRDCVVPRVASKMQRSLTQAIGGCDISRCPKKALDDGQKPLVSRSVQGGHTVSVGRRYVVRVAKEFAHSIVIASRDGNSTQTLMPAISAVVHLSTSRL